MPRPTARAHAALLAVGVMAACVSQAAAAGGELRPRARVLQGEGEVEVERGEGGGARQS